MKPVTHEDVHLLLDWQFHAPLSGFHLRSWILCLNQKKRTGNVLYFLGLQAEMVSTFLLWLLFFNLSFNTTFVCYCNYHNLQTMYSNLFITRITFKCVFAKNICPFLLLRNYIIGNLFVCGIDRF